MQLIQSFLHWTSYPEKVLLFLFLLTCHKAPAQVADNINHYFSKIAGSPVAEERLSFNDSIKKTLIKYLESTDDINATNITGVNYLGQISSSDSLLKIFSWNIPLSPGSNLYNCIIYKRNNDSLFILESDRGLQGLGTDEVIESTNWYGSLYYDIQTVDKEGDISYILLGFAPDNINVNSKLVEILHFSDNGEPLFGKEIIFAGDNKLRRMIFRYSPLATMMLRFNKSRSKIVFDHLSPSSAQFEGVYKYYGPDFSFDALEIREGKLILVEDVDPREDE